MSVEFFDPTGTALLPAFGFQGVTKLVARNIIAIGEVRQNEELKIGGLGIGIDAPFVRLAYIRCRFPCGVSIVLPQSCKGGAVRSTVGVVLAGLPRKLAELSNYHIYYFYFRGFSHVQVRGSWWYSRNCGVVNANGKNVFPALF